MKRNFANYLLEKKFSKNINKKANDIITHLEKRYGKTQLIPDDHYEDVYLVSQEAPDLLNYIQVFYQGPNASSYDENLTEGFTVTNEDASKWYTKDATYDRTELIRAIESCAKEENIPEI